jgi:hypothetical protein
LTAAKEILLGFLKGKKLGRCWVWIGVRRVWDLNTTRGRVSLPFQQFFIQEVKSDFNKPLDIVLAGGTSMPSGFDKKVDSIVRSFDLPFKINSVRKSKDPRNSVVTGLLTQAEIVRRKLEKGQITKDSI